MIVDTREMTLAEAERLLKLCQECAEVVQAATKAMLYGWAPHFNGVQYDNRADLVEELGDVRNVENLMCRKGDMSAGEVATVAQTKVPRMLAHMRYQHEEPYWPVPEDLVRASYRSSDDEDNN